jgi:hypothetical protein
MFELKIASIDATSGTVPVSWCVDTETLKLLSEKSIKEPQVVIVVAPDGPNYHITKEYRKVVPLEDLMTYVEFRAAGPNKIWGFISKRSQKDARNHYLHREAGQYHTDILSDDGSDFCHAFSVQYNPDNEHLNSPPISVKVPTQCFAKEPWAWEKTWVNHFFRSKCVDQCEYRRRRIFAYTLQPFIMFFNMLIRFVLLVGAALVAARNITLAPLFHPLSYSINDAWEGCTGGSFAIQHLEEDDRNHWEPKGVIETYSYVFRSFWSLPLMPVLAIPLLLLVYFHCWFALSVIGVIVAFVLLIVGIVAAILTGSLRSFFRSATSTQEDEDEDEKLWYMDREQMDMLVCNPDKKPLTLASLPASKKTLRLRFLDLKSKVCRPFSV